ncbi:hypothetical protein Tco_1099986 [Tanacetum coccineum]
MAWLPKCAELQEAVGSWEWVYMMVLYCRRSVVEDHKFARQINRLRGEMTVASEERVYFVQELEIMAGVIASQKTTESLNKTQVKDDEKMIQLQNLKREME